MNYCNLETYSIKLKCRNSFVWYNPIYLWIKKQTWGKVHEFVNKRTAKLATKSNQLPSWCSDRALQHKVSRILSEEISYQNSLQLLTWISDEMTVWLANCLGLKLQTNMPKQSFTVFIQIYYTNRGSTNVNFPSRLWRVKNSEEFLEGSEVLAAADACNLPMATRQLCTSEEWLSTDSLPSAGHRNKT